MDEMELAHQETKGHEAYALARHMARSMTVQLGAEACVECGGLLPAERQQMGANRCVECQRDVEFLERKFTGSR